MSAGATDGEQRAGDVGRRCPARVVADAEPLVGAPKTTSVETTKLGTRTEWTCVPAIVAPRASGCPATSATGRPISGARTAPKRSASSRAVPLGASGLVDFA